MSEATPTKNASGSEAPANPYPAWCPRFWHGMRCGVWWRAMAQNRFKIAWHRAHIALAITGFTPINDVLALAQSAIHGRAIAKTKLDKPPVFILGHWRSGTTLLHELLVSDDDFECPNTFQCFAPAHFLLSEPLMVKLGGFLLPKHRPMDNMEAGWLLPQEDEFALTNLGVPSPYLRIAFPETQDKRYDYLDMKGLSDEALSHWRAKLEWFLKVLTYHHGGKQLVLKSPPHTGRIAELAAMFPGAKFVHLTRDPVKLFTSTIRLWNSLDAVQAMQNLMPESEMEEYVVQCLKTMYASFEAGREKVPTENIVDVRYEDLVRDPFSTVQGLYEQLELGDFSGVEENLKTRLADHHQYQPNQHAIDDQLRQKVLDLWPEYAEKYGYVVRQPSAQAV